MIASKYFMLVDCNNFYVSCERVFNPALLKKPVVVLSNNDGCVISRSNEAKAIGITMGVPFFQCQALLKRYQGIALSSNYALYDDMSKRVMQILQSFTPDLEIYSIDEAFLCFNILTVKEIYTLALKIRETILQYTGLPVSVGIAANKTLAKLANNFAKKQSCSGVYLLAPEHIDSLLAKTPLNEIWGLGSRLCKRLHGLNIQTALDLKNSNPLFMRKKINVILERMVYELNGLSCLSLEECSVRKSIRSARSFGTPLTDFQSIAAALSNYTANAAYKLRQQNSVTTAITVFLMTNKHHSKKYYSNSDTIYFSTPTDNTAYLIKYAKHCLEKIYVAGLAYQKTGILLMELMPKEFKQLDLFENPMSAKQEALIATFDTINQAFGKNTIFYAAQGGIKKPWTARRNYRSPAYTTCWADIVTVG